MEIPTGSDLDVIMEAIRKLEETKIYEQIKPTDITEFIDDIFVMNGMTLSMARDLIHLFHQRLQLHEKKRIERCTGFYPQIEIEQYLATCNAVKNEETKVIRQ